MTIYPQSTTNWTGEPRPYKVYRDNEGYAVLFRDINGWRHALFTWSDGDTTFQWKTAWAASDDMEVTDIPLALLKLADAWQEYLDAVVERETG